MNYMLNAQEAMKHALAATILPSLGSKEREAILVFLNHYCVRATFNLTIGAEHIKTLIEQVHQEAIFHFLMPLSYRFRAFYGTDTVAERKLIDLLSEVLGAPPEVTNREMGSAVALNKDVRAKLNVPSENNAFFSDNPMFVALAVLNITGLGAAYANSHMNLTGKPKSGSRKRLGTRTDGDE